MRENQRVNRSHSKRAQRGGHNALTHVKCGTGQTTRVNQRGSAIREPDQRRVALPDIKKNNAQGAGGHSLDTNICGKRRPHNHHRGKGDNANSADAPEASNEEKAAAAVIKSNQPPGWWDGVLRSPCRPTSRAGRPGSRIAGARREPPIEGAPPSRDA